MPHATSTPPGRPALCRSPVTNVPCHKGRGHRRQLIAACTPHGGGR